MSLIKKYGDLIHNDIANSCIVVLNKNSYKHLIIFPLLVLNLLEINYKCGRVDVRVKTMTSEN